MVTSRPGGSVGDKQFKEETNDLLQGRYQNWEVCCNSHQSIKIDPFWLFFDIKSVGVHLGLMTQQRV